MPPQDESSQSSQFDPSTKNVDEVQKYLDGADQEERDRVLAAEKEGKNRTTVLNYEPTSIDEDGEDDSEDSDSDADGNEDEKTEGNQIHPSGAEVDTSDEKREERQEELEEESEKAAGGDVPEGYDPYSDPMVPSSSLADNIALELKSGNGSPTLQALHDNKKDDDEKKDDKSTS